MRPPDDSYWRKGKTCFVDPSKIEQKEGCPCGCDHSEAMVKELAAIGPDERRRRIDRSLAQIAEREGAGYITEDMVRHRLRLSSLRSSLKAPGEPTPAAPRPLALTPTCGRDVCVAAELVAHADNHVVIRDRPKHLRACHVLRVEVTNRSGDDRQIVAQFGLPVARWYCAGTAGAPWDGGLAAGESASLVAIGYTAPLQPHEDVRTTVQIDDVAIPVSTRARARWDQPE